MDNNLNNITRDILDPDGNIIGQLTLPDGTPENIWTIKLAEYSTLQTDLPIEIKIKNKILAAMDFGKNLIVEYATSNILSGFTIEQIQYIVQQTMTVQIALNTGSLYVALDELSKIPIDDSIITIARIAEFRHKIQDYLGITRT